MSPLSLAVRAPGLQKLDPQKSMLFSVFFVHFANSSWMFGPVNLLNVCFRTNAKHSFRPVLPLKPTFCFQEEENLRNCFTSGREALFLSKKKKLHPCDFALQNILQLCQKTSMWASVTSERNGFGSGKRVLWAPNYSNKHLFSPNKHTFHGNVSFLVKRFPTTKFFRPKKQELGFAPRNSRKTWEK